MKENSKRKSDSWPAAGRKTDGKIGGKENLHQRKYWENYIGDTDDSLTFVEYPVEKGKEEIAVEEIFSDVGVDKLNGDFRGPEDFPVYADEEGWEMDIQYAISLLTDLATILLEGKVNGNKNL